MLLLSYGAKSSPVSHPRITLSYFSLRALLPYPPHAIVMRLHGRDVGYVVTLIRKKADLLGMWEVAGPVPATGGSQP